MLLKSVNPHFITMAPNVVFYTNKVKISVTPVPRGTTIPGGALEYKTDGYVPVPVFQPRSVLEGA